MHVYIVFAHPSKASFTGQVLDSFCRGLKEAGHSFEVGDLYKMNFQSDMDISQFKRETAMDADAPIPEDVKREQAKIDKADALVFIYPVWWSDCPAKLKGWFDRVLTYGYAYFYDESGNRGTQIDIEKALIICPAGNTIEYLEEIGIAESMRYVMINDRLLGVGVKQADMVILDGIMPNNTAIAKRHLEKAYKLGRNFS